MTETNGAARAAAPATAEAGPPAKMTWDELHALVRKAEGGDRKALPRLREALKSADHADWARWFRDNYGNPAEWLRTSLAREGPGKDRLASIEAAGANMEQIRDELAGPAPTPIERLLAERAATCWFTVNLYETLFSQSSGQTLRQAEYHLRKIDSAHKRYLSSLATLARVRKLALPALQVNVGTNQVNVARAGG
jgi:hypothetical protein